MLLLKNLIKCGEEVNVKNVNVGSFASIQLHNFQKIKLNFQHLPQFDIGYPELCIS